MKRRNTKKKYSKFNTIIVITSLLFTVFVNFYIVQQIIHIIIQYKNICNLCFRLVVLLLY